MVQVNNKDGLQSYFYNNQVPVYQQRNLLLFQAATDTVGGRSASYHVVVYDDVDAKTIRGYCAYGKIGAAQQRTDLNPYTYRNEAERMNMVSQVKSTAHRKMQEKLNKNYLLQEEFDAAYVLKRDRSIDKYAYIPVYDGDFPDRVEHSKDAHDAILQDPNLVWERFPNRMRMMYVVLFHDGIALYNVSGGLTGDIQYDQSYQPNAELLEDIGEGLVFTGHRDPVGNIVIHHYLRQLGNEGVKQKVLTWAQQKSMTTYFFNTLYNGKEDIYDSNLLIYLNDYVTGEQDARAMIANPDPGYATNVMFHNPHSPIGILNYLER